ncbi:MAG: glycosyltransferase family 2 protein [Spirochaetaceae bacterium]|nr:glycosyltransferase family 2 protein [Spirochaetaceae bacterium]
MPYKTKVSIITPIYNGADFIEDTALCLAKQTFTDYEWVVIDDCSTDDTKEVLQRLSDNDKRIKLVFLQKNSGPIVARNKGMDDASGRFIAFLDADDIWVPEKLEKQLAFMEENQTALSFTSFRKIDLEGNITSRFRIPVPRKVNYAKLIESNCIPASSAMFDREIVGEMRQDSSKIISKDDFFFWLEMLKVCHTAMGMKEDLFRLRIHKKSITNDKLEMARRHWKMYREVFHFSVLKSLRYYIIYSIKGLAKYLM